VVAPADHKNVAAIERLIGKTIPWMGEQPAGIADEGPAPRPHRKHAERRNGRGPKRSDTASVAVLEDARSRRSHKPAPAAEGGHLPAFLLRPVRAKA